MVNVVSALNICYYLIEVLFFNQENKSLKNKMSSEFNLFFNFWCTIDENDSMMWPIFNEKISILYYFNNGNIDLEYILMMNMIIRLLWNYDYNKRTDY